MSPRKFGAVVAFYVVALGGVAILSQEIGCTKQTAAVVGPAVGTVVVTAGCDLVSILDPVLATTLAAVCPVAQQYVGNIIAAIVGLTSPDVAALGMPEPHLDPVDLGGGQTALVRRDLVPAFRAEAAKRGPFVPAAARGRK